MLKSIGNECLKGLNFQETDSWFASYSLGIFFVTEHLTWEHMFQFQLYAKNHDDRFIKAY